MDGVCSGVIQFPTVEDCLDWLQAIASNISSLTKHNVSMKLKDLLALLSLAVTPMLTNETLGWVLMQQSFNLLTV